MTDVLFTSDPKSKVIRKELDIGGLKTCLPPHVTCCAGDPSNGGGSEHPQGRCGAIEVDEARRGSRRQLPHPPAVCPTQSV